MTIDDGQLRSLIRFDSFI